LLLLVLSVLWSGLHEHERSSDLAHDQCAACAWQSNSITDIPIAQISPRWIPARILPPVFQPPHQTWLQLTSQRGRAPPFAIL
jgi:hypothetical protein